MYLDPVSRVTPNPIFTFLVMLSLKMKGNGNSNITTSVIIFGKLAYKNSFSISK